jgi:DNA-3-methyladenine glycosylase I
MTDTSPFGAPEPGVAPAAALEAGLAIGPDGKARCFWGAGSAESGLSWITILRKRESFRKAFAGFAIDAVAAFSAADVQRLLTDPGIVRNRMKIDAALHNARVAADLPDGLAKLLWSYAPVPRRARPATRAEVPASTPESTAMAKDLKKRGFKFVGPTTAYALMQATGMVDDHLAGCFVPPITTPGDMSQSG